MEGRERVRRHLMGRGADRPPLVAFATAFAARLDQVDADALWQDPGALTRALMSLDALFGLDAIVVDVPRAALRSDALSGIADGVARLRALLGDRAALVLALPGPLTQSGLGGATTGELEERGDELLEAAKRLGPEHADCLAIVERAPVGSDDAQPLDDALAPLWNTARHYSVASLLLAAEGGLELADTGADAVSVWSGVSPQELAARGARCVGCAGRAVHARARASRAAARGLLHRAWRAARGHRDRLAAPAGRGGGPVSDEAILASAAKDVGPVGGALSRAAPGAECVGATPASFSRAADLLAGALRDAGCDVSLKDSGTPGMPMLQARLRGRRGGPALLLAGHMEVYPPSESWTLDPWAATVRDGRVYAQGAADMKGGTAGMCAAAAVLGRAGVDLPGDLIVLAVPNHFEGGEGTRKAVREGLHADAAIVCEPTDLLVVTGQRGILYLEITVRGRAAHTTALRIGVNAIERASRIALALHAMGERDSDGEPVGAAPIVNVAMVQGGLVHNIVPERCVLTVDIRFAPEQTAEDVLRDVRAAVAAAVPDEPDLPTSVQPEHTCVRNPRSSLRLAGDHPLAHGCPKFTSPPMAVRPLSGSIPPGPTLRSSTKRAFRRSRTGQDRWSATGTTSSSSSRTTWRRCGATAWRPRAAAGPRCRTERRRDAGSAERGHRVEGPAAGGCNWNELLISSAYCINGSKRRRDAGDR